ncbi:GrpB family protein [Brachybacterium aquaticum]|uniref:GrpB-like predicted nucleotidyltransferase (UPF0157 family) n=1 Tax=Brachybacterium aquaticum TaxID=1432564 RepID=A0A841AC27_9MICO|nr:GrpB family protein [Brachybacterium aquaticum]MBB5830734.1 GrpB-like predicted nucleotidyltransferase (UPF0157 family) [Brachybacterium aquaticum]
MPTPREILTVSDDAPPPGETPWVVPPVVQHIDVVPADPTWPARFEALAARLRSALGGRALAIDHVGSTSVPGLAAKPILDVDLIVADPADEEVWLPALESDCFVLTVREPWWQGHRMLRLDAPRAHLHVFGPDAAEPWRHRIFRDHLRRSDEDRALYAETKHEVAALSNAEGEQMMEYNRRKQDVIREIYARAFAAAGLR